jgi:hypothetical protein
LEPGVICKKFEFQLSHPRASSGRESDILFCLVELESGNVILLYDVHRGKSHHRHLRGNETGYKFVDEDTLLADFLRNVSLILEGNL